MFEWFFKVPPEVYRTAELDYAFTGSPWLLAGLFGAGALVLAAALWLRRTLSPARRLGIFVAQLALVGLALWLLAQPELVDEQPVAGSNTVALILDDSASMAYLDGGVSRLDAARRWLDRVAGDLAGTYAIERLTLSNLVDDNADYAELAATGATTPLATQIAALVERRRGDALAAIVVASDGLTTETDAGAALDTLAAAGVPVFARRIGRTAVPEDLALATIEVPDEALAGAAFETTLTIRHDRGGEARVRVLANDDTLLAAETVELDPDRTATKVTLPVVLSEPGFQTLTVELVPAGDEQERRNNRTRRVVAVPERDYRILYFEGEPRWEYKFMRRAIGADEDIRLTSLLRVSPNKYYRQGLTDPDELAGGFPESAATLYAYDAVILGSVEAAALSAAQQQLLHDFVSVRGGTLLLLAGPNGLGNGGWGESAVARALPTTLPAFGTDTFVRRRAALAPTAYARTLPALSLADDPGGGWRDLPEVADYQSVGELKPAAQALLTRRNGAGQEPVLVTQPYGRGHSYVLGTGGTWRWQMQLPVEDQRHERFWRQLLRALVTAAPQQTTVRVVATGTGSGIEAALYDEVWEPLGGLTVNAAVDAGSGGSSAALALTPVAGQPGLYRGTWPDAGQGIHYVEATAQRGDAVIATARTAFAGATVSPEHRRVRASDAQLAALAGASGGVLLETTDTAPLASALRRSSAGVTELTREPIWDAPIVFLLLLGLKTLEWLLRRRWGQI